MEDSPASEEDRTAHAKVEDDVAKKRASLGAQRLACQVSTVEICHAIDALKIGKALGHDVVSNEMLIVAQ